MNKSNEPAATLDMRSDSARLGPQLSFCLDRDEEPDSVEEKILSDAVRDFEDYRGTVSWTLQALRK